MIKTIETTHDTTKAYFNGVLVEYKRIKNDVYGNPLYKVTPVNFCFRQLAGVYRNYKPSYQHDGYYLLQSYNIATDLQDLMQEVSEKVNFPPFDEAILDKHGYKEVKTLQDQQKEAL